MPALDGPSFKEEPSEWELHDAKNKDATPRTMERRG